MFASIRPAPARVLACGLVASLLALPVAVAAAEPESPDAEAASEAVPSNVLERKGIRVEFSAAPVAGDEVVKEGGFVDMSFRLTSTEDQSPVISSFPGVWLDLAKAWSGRGTGSMACKDRVAMYLQGTVGMRPMVDLNSYFILVMTSSDAISVIDPYVGMTGITNLYAQINLSGVPGDWAKSADQTRLYVSIPERGQVGVVDLQSFKVSSYVQVGPNPLRVGLQPDEKYLWVAHNPKPGKPGEPGGVVAVDRDTLQVAARIETGRGHHELAFSADSRYAFVTNRDDATVSVIDVQTLEKVRDIAVEGLPISIAYSGLGNALYIADAERGEMLVVRGDAHEVVATIDLKPGLGPVRFTKDGRWAFAVNTAEDVVYVIDVSDNRLEHTLAVGDRPYQLGFTPAFAYVRALGSERVSMVNLGKLGGEEPPPVVTFPAGSKPPAQAGSVSIAEAIAQTAEDAGVLVVSPADATVYYYMEGMNAPMGAFRNYGLNPTAVAIADRSLTEKEPGVYSARVKIPAAGTYDVAFLLETPEILHCFSLKAEPNDSLDRPTGPMHVEYLDAERIVQAGETYKLRFRLKAPVSGEPLAGIEDAGVVYYRAPAFGRTVVRASEVEPGLYEAALKIPARGAYYVYLMAPSQGVKAGDIAFITLRTDRTRRLPKPAPTGDGAKQANVGGG